MLAPSATREEATVVPDVPECPTDPALCVSTSQLVLTSHT
jgi:hypothetical protein